MERVTIFMAKLVCDFDVLEIFKNYKFRYEFDTNEYRSYKKDGGKLFGFGETFIDCLEFTIHSIVKEAYAKDVKEKDTA